LASMARKIMPLLFKLLTATVAATETASASASGGGVQQQQWVMETLGLLSRVAPPPFVNTLFKTLMQKLLQATLELGTVSGGGGADLGASGKQQTQVAVGMCDLAMTLVPVLDTASVALLYTAVKPMLNMDDNAQFQKRCYRILDLVCEHHPSFALDSEERLTELLSLLTGSLLTCHVSSRQMRLRCLDRLVSCFDPPTAEAAVPSLVGEVILCTKDANAKCRDAAFDLLVSMSKRMPSNTHFMRIVSAALAAHTPHMRSAAVLALARLIAVFAPTDPELCETVPELTSTILLLLREQAREVVKAVLCFLRLALAVCAPDKLEPILPDMIDGVMKWAGETKNRFKATIKLIMKKLCRLFTFETVSALLPEADQALIAYLQRMALRSSRKRLNGQVSSTSAASAGGAGTDMDSDDDDDGDVFEDGEDREDDEEEEEEEDNDDEEEDQVFRMGRGGSGSGRQQSSGGDTELFMKDHGEAGEVVDLLDSERFMKHVQVVHKPRQGGKAASGDNGPTAGDDEDGDLVIGKDGRLVISDPSLVASDARSKQKKRGRDNDDDEEGGDDDDEGARGGAASSSSALPPPKRENKQQRKKQMQQKRAGAEFRSNKKGTGGDVQKAGQAYEPYAYIPLDGKILGSKKKHAAMEQYSGVIGSGNAKGSKGKEKGHQKKGKRR